MITTMKDGHGHVRSYFGVGEPDHVLKHLADVRKEMDLGFMCDEWHILSVLDLHAAPLKETMTIHVLRGTEPVVREERKFLKKRFVRVPREWIGTIRYSPADGFVVLNAEAYGPKGLAQQDEETGRMVLVDEDDSLVIMSNLLTQTMRRSKNDVRIVLHRAERSVRHEEIHEGDDDAS